jgi:hypothetical protein
LPSGELTLLKEHADEILSSGTNQAAAAVKVLQKAGG